MIAKFYGICADCRTDISEGEEIVWDEQWVHAECMRVEKKDPPLCTDCFIMHAGECP